MGRNIFVSYRIYNFSKQCGVLWVLGLPGPSPKTSPDTSPDISEANHGTMSKKTFLRASAAIVLGIPAAVLTAGVFYHEKRKPVLPPATLRKDLAHATIVMTGATSGIGQATALQLATSGASFILGSRDAQRSEETTSTLLEAGATSVKTFELDISNMKSVQTFCDQVLAHTPNGIDVVVSAAAEIHTEPEGQRTKEGIDLSFATNHLGLHVLLQQLEPVLLQQRHRNKGDHGSCWWVQDWKPKDPHCCPYHH
jgi:NADPH:quinone reductase-like Zn-dependent oxidoreductase